MRRSEPRRRVLVTDGEQRATLAVVRSLGAAGYEVHVAAYKPGSLAAGSRYVHTEHIVTSALADPRAFVDDLFAVVMSERCGALIPMTEPALLAVLPQRARFCNTIIPFPDAATFIDVSDKRAVLDAANKSGISIPAQSVVDSSAAARSIDYSDLEYPIVVKPSRSVSTSASRRLRFAVRHASSAEDLRTILDSMAPETYPLLLQRRVVGPGVGIFVLVWEGRLVAQFAHQRIREKPPSGGVSVYRSSIAVDPDLLQASLDLLAQFHWRGVAMVEYKIDELTGTPYLMEINGRFWGSLQLAIDAGADFPRLLLEAASGQVPEPVTQFRTGVRSRWFWGDVDHLLARLLKSDAQLMLPPGGRTRLQAIMDFFTHHTDDVSEVWREDDPKPFLRESAKWIRQVFGR